MEVLGVLFLCLTAVWAQQQGSSLKFVVVIEPAQPQVSDWLSSAFAAAETKNSGIKLDQEVIILDRDNDDEAYSKLCATVASGVSVLLDLTWYPWERAKVLAESWGLLYIKSDISIQVFVAALDQYLDLRNATDAAIIFQSEEEVDQALYYMIEQSSIRIWVEAGTPARALNSLRSLRPSPSFYAIVGDTQFISDAYTKVVEAGLVYLDQRWHLVFTDYKRGDFDPKQLLRGGSLISSPASDCCRLLDLHEGCECSRGFSRERAFLDVLISYIAHVLSGETALEPVSIQCDVDPTPNPGGQQTRSRTIRRFKDDSRSSNASLIYWDDNKGSGLFFRAQLDLQLFNSTSESVSTLARWTADRKLSLLRDQEIKPVKRFFRVGTTSATPWTMVKRDPETGQPLVDEKGNPIYEGYCIDLIQKLSEVMNFDYEIITPKMGTFGRRQENGSWTGIVGDLTRGETDIAVAALTMTSDREEVIDFVAPYFEQTGILIVIRKPVRKTSLFKFMTVLKTEVWLSILAALIATGICIWLLDKYSPYSARNNPQAYPYPCRIFTLKESFWFALTSFTPQGGGEAPKALSGRTLVAAYWLFVVLMLATFTANLAAFLTVERMQSPVSSLEQLARQSRINYTVVESSTVHQYFINMKLAEDTLYRVWKEITLKASSDQSKYRVWDYPIREQYGHILLAINSSNPVDNASVGFQMVEDHVDADFAFIHDSAEIKYEVTRNCNLTEVGEIFAEQPYAVAVQQGSHLQEELSRRLLDLQKDRFLEELVNRYWNQSLRGSCANSDESEGITLESLGGVFIATLFGLGLAMLTLAWEVFYYKRKEKNMVQTIDSKPDKEEKKEKGLISIKKDLFFKPRKQKVGPVKRITIGGDTFKPVADGTKKISYISVYPKDVLP